MQLPKFELEEFLEWEKLSPERHEFHAGVVYGMAGGSAEHAEGIASMAGELRNLAKGMNCRTLSSEMAVWVSDKETFLYPDVVLVCGKMQFHERNRRMLTNPRLIVEVLSPSTRDYDLSSKFAIYQNIASFDEYLAMEPAKVEVHHWLKDGRGRWVRKKYTSRAAKIPVRALGKELSLADVYDGLI